MPKRVPVDKLYLVPQLKPIHDPHKKPYFAIRYVSLEENKKRVKDYLKERNRGSYTVRYLKKNPFDVNVVTQAELMRDVEKNKAGEQIYYSINVKLIKNTIEFKHPENCRGVLRIISLQNGGYKIQCDSEKRAKNKIKNFKRVKNVGKGIKEFKSSIAEYLIRPEPDQKKQLGVVLNIMVTYDIRVGSGEHSGIAEGSMSVADLKRGMVISHPSWPVGTPPHVVIEEKTPEGINKIFLRSIEYSEHGNKAPAAEKLREYKKQLKVLERINQKQPGNPEHRAELSSMMSRYQDLFHEISIPLPANFKEVIRVGHYGATQLEARHVKYPAPGEVWLDFVGKSGQRWIRQIRDKTLAEAIQSCQKGKAGNQPLFPDVDRRLVAKTLRKYRIAKPKDLRTYEGTKVFVEESTKHPVPTTKKELRLVEKAIFKAVSKQLGNTPGMAKNSYTDPTVYTAWRSGILEQIDKTKQLNKSLYYYIILL